MCVCLLYMNLYTFMRVSFDDEVYTSRNGKTVPGANTSQETLTNDYPTPRQRAGLKCKILEVLDALRGWSRLRSNQSS